MTDPKESPKDLTAGEPTLNHKSVLVSEVLTYLNPQPNGVYLDVTLGAGGHTRAILDAEPTCKVIGMDWDQKTLDIVAPQLEAQYGNRFEAIWGNFATLYRLQKRFQIGQVNGILADFGTSQMQIHTRDGFSFQHDTPLDMRMSGGHALNTAAQMLAQASESYLMAILRDYGEEHKARAIAQAIVAQREVKPITTTKELADLVIKVLRKKNPRMLHGPTHPATKTFQALRIAVNKELENIELFLPVALNMLAPGGRLVCISFHSLEDRIVKTFFRNHAQDQTMQLITKKAVMATPEEIARNKSSRSARLRAIEKIK